MSSITLSTSSAIFAWQPAAWLRVTGADAGSFLQGQLTNDLRRLDSEPVVYGLWLTVKGKVLADSFVLKGGAADEFWIGSYACEAGVIRERLESYIIADDVVVDDHTADWGGMSILGDFDAETAQAKVPGSFVFPGRRSRPPNSEWVFPRSAEAAVREYLRGARDVGAEEMERRRIEARIPAVPVDLGPSDLPNEGGLDQEAVSYTKGCYLGQEVMARLKSMGKVRRRLLRVRGGTSETPRVLAPLFLGARQVGELRSTAAVGEGGFIGLAMLSLINVKPDSVLSLAADGEPCVRLEDTL